LREYFRLAIKTINRLDELLPKLEKLERRIGRRLLTLEKKLSGHKKSTPKRRAKSEAKANDSGACLSGNSDDAPPATESNSDVAEEVKLLPDGKPEQFLDYLRAEGDQV